ncbi:hypothetical protein AB0F81_36880 [Actinoplanes sp. NPDC024001]|uniref:hypothetical protein n=1 Tax=Actinoplanes sp. NPDC024001 TaxID=3154598 RepID=UPI0033D093C0
MDHFTFSAHPTESQIRTALATFLRGQYRLVRAAGVLIVLLSLVPLVLEGSFFGLLLGLAFVFVVPPLSTWIMMRMIRPQVLRETHYELDEHGVRMTNDQTDQLFRWSGVTKVDQVDGMLVGRLGRMWMLVIPVGVLPPETASAVTSLVLSRVPAQR